MLTKIIIFALIIFMLWSLFSALYYMMKDRGHGTRTVKALTWRIAVWIVLLVILVVGVKTGWIEPSMSVTPPQYKSAN